MDSPQKGSLLQNLRYSLLLTWTSFIIHSWTAGDLKRHGPHVTSLWCVSGRACVCAWAKVHVCIPRMVVCTYMCMRIVCMHHYHDVIMGIMASQITSLTIVYSTLYSSTNQRKHQSSASLAFVWGIHRWPVNSPHKWPVTRKMFPFDDVIMMYVLPHALIVLTFQSILI